VNVLAFVQGITNRLFDMSVAAAHARLLLVPLFFMCESWIGPPP
jgi:hypothetical protein